MNGVGPFWFPTPVRRLLTSMSNWFFREADWQRHDIGYERGRPSRVECDRKFLRAMLHDAAEQPVVWRMAAACVLAWAFYIAVRIGGWISYGRGRSADKR